MKMRRNKCGPWRWAVIVLLALWSVSATADESAIEAHGQGLFERGVQAYRQGRYAEAQALWERSFAYSPRRRVFWNLAAGHLSQGHRDLGVGFLIRYMDRDLPYLESSEMQAAVAAIADSPAQIEDPARRVELARQVNEANSAVSEGRSTPVPEGDRRFGSDIQTEEAARIWTARKALDRELFSEGVRLAQARSYPEALVYFERCLVYRTHRNALWNIAACHLSQGRRDFALHFIDGYLDRTPEARESDRVQAVVSALADESPNIPDVGRRFELWSEFAAATTAALVADEVDTDGGDS